MSSVELLELIVLNGLVKGLLFSLLFTALLFIHHFYGPGPEVRDERGKKVIPPEFKRFVITETIVLVVLMIGFGLWANLTLAAQMQESPSFLTYLAQCYAVLWIVNLWDLVVIDWILVVRFRPAFLELPDTPYFNQIRPHLIGWFKGHLFILLPALVTAGLSFLLIPAALSCPLPGFGNSEPAS